MVSGYEVHWTDHALEELASTFHYLEQHFPEKVLVRLSHEIEKVTFLIAKHPKLFPESDAKQGVRKAVVEKFNTLYYRISETNQIEILSFFSNRQDPGRITL